MAATALDVITAALRKLRVLGAGASPTASETDDCLDELNQMLAAWSINGVDLAPVTLASGDVLDVPDNHIEAIKLNLAVRIADDFGRQPSPILISNASAAKAMLVAYHFTMKDLLDDNPLSRSNLATDE